MVFQGIASVQRTKTILLPLFLIFQEMQRCSGRPWSSTPAVCPHALPSRLLGLSLLGSWAPSITYFLQLPAPITKHIPAAWQWARKNFSKENNQPPRCVAWWVLCRDISGTFQAERWVSPSRPHSSHQTHQHGRVFFIHLFGKSEHQPCPQLPNSASADCTMTTVLKVGLPGGQGPQAMYLTGSSEKAIWRWDKEESCVQV